MATRAGETASESVNVDWVGEIGPSVYARVAGFGVGVNPSPGGPALVIQNPDRLVGAVFNMTWSPAWANAEILSLSLFKGAGDDWRLVTQEFGRSPLLLMAPDVNTTRDLILLPQFVPAGSPPAEATVAAPQEVRIVGRAIAAVPAEQG